MERRETVKKIKEGRGRIDEREKRRTMKKTGSNLRTKGVKEKERGKEKEREKKKQNKRGLGTVEKMDGFL